MTVKFGFFDSLNSDRLYNANDINTFFEGVFSDGVFEFVGGALDVEHSPGTMNVLVNTGRAWFNNLWLRNTSTLTLAIEPSSLIHPRKDLVVLEFDSSITVRENSIKVLTGIPAAIPIAPTLANTSTLHQYALAEIYVDTGVSEITAIDITNKIGTIGTPYATSLLSEPSTAPPTTALNDFQLGDGSGNWITKTKIETYNILKPHSILSGRLFYNSENSYQIEAGAEYVNYETLIFGSPIVRNSLSLSANTLYNVYLYNNAGIPSIEESTTNPVWDVILDCYKKTGDNSRRWMGYICTNASGNIRRFVHILIGDRTSEIIFVDGSITGKDVANGGSVTTNWTAMDLSKLVPIPATHYYAVPKLVGGAANDDAVAGISPIDLGSGISGNLSPFLVRGDNDIAGSTIFFGTVWLNIYEPQTSYYRIFDVVGTGSLLVLQVHGSRFIR